MYSQHVSLTPVTKKSLCIQLSRCKMVRSKDGQPSQLSDKLAQIRYEVLHCVSDIIVTRLHELYIFRLTVSSLVPCRNLLPAYHQCYPTLLAQGKVRTYTVTQTHEVNLSHHMCVCVRVRVWFTGVGNRSTGHAQWYHF